MISTPFSGGTLTVEKRHHKLWLPGTAVLQRVLHSDVVTLTEFTLARIRRDIRRYVPTNCTA